MQLVTVTSQQSLRTIGEHTPVSQFGRLNGTATVNVTGGALPYSYLWTPGGQTTASISGHTAGTYSVVVTDDMVAP